MNQVDNVEPPNKQLISILIQELAQRPRSQPWNANQQCY